METVDNNDDGTRYGVLRETRGEESHEEVRIPNGVGYENFRNASRAAKRMNEHGRFDNARAVPLDTRDRTPGD